MKLKTLKPINETKYLSVENAWRYRVIMRTFYIKDQQFSHWLTNEDVFEEVKKLEEFNEYTIDMCKSDLEMLSSWGNLHSMQDTSKVKTYQQFVNKQYRYQLSEYSIEIERMTVRLENIFIEGGSLEPTLLERIKHELKKIDEISGMDELELGGWWSQLTHDFQRLNQNYQDYLRDWYGVKAEELMKTQNFILYKERLIEYLRNFIKELQLHGYEIERDLKNISEEHKIIMFQKISDYEMSIPRIDMEAIKYDDVYDLTKDKYMSIEKFFLGSSNQASEVEIIMSMTNEIIRRITRYAANILEITGQYSNRKEEYLKIINLFAETNSLEEAHELSANVFGISKYKHFVFDFERETDSIYSSIYDEKPFELVLNPRIRNYREKMKKTAIIDYSERKEQMRQNVLHARENEKKILLSYLRTGLVDFKTLDNLPSHVRRTMLKWLSKGIAEKGEFTTTEHGMKFRLLNPTETEICKIYCEDGYFEMPAYILEFEGEVNARD